MIATLQRVALFSDLSATELAAIAAEVSVSRQAAGQIIFAEGDRGGDLLIVSEGKVKVVRMAASGRHQLIAIEGPGSTLGEVSLFEGGPYSATAIALEPSVLIRLRGDRFKRLCLAHPEVAFKVIQVLGHRLRHLRRLVEDLSFATVRQRLIAYLLRLAEDSVFVLHENNEELAGRLGTVRELVSRNLGRLHGEGLIVMGPRRAVTIPDVELLRAELEP